MKAIFRKILILFFLSIYSVTASGFHLILHYCEGEVAFYGINGKLSAGADECCVDEDILSISAQEEIDAEDCCQNKADYIKIQDAQIKSENLKGKTPIFEYVSHHAMIMHECRQCFRKTSIAINSVFNAPSPPGPATPDFIVFRNLRI
jgi:hypothetical protein